MQNNLMKIVIGKKVIYTALGIAISLIIIFNIHSKQDASAKEDSNKVVLYEFTASVNSNCDEICLNELNKMLLNKDSVHEVNYGNNQLSIVYDGNKLSQNDLISFIDIPISVISNEKVIMTCPDDCAYCNAETGICKSFG